MLIDFLINWLITMFCPTPSQGDTLFVLYGQQPKKIFNLPYKNRQRQKILINRFPILCFKTSLQKSMDHVPYGACVLFFSPQSMYWACRCHEAYIYTVNPITQVPRSQNAHSTLLSFCFLVKWFFEQQSQARGAIERMRHMAALPPPARLCSKHLKTSQSPPCCLLYQRVSGNLSESSLRYSRGPSSASMQITSAHWQLFCCYLLWYSTSSSFRDLREARPESIPGSWKCHIGTDCSQPSFAFEY